MNIDEMRSKDWNYCDFIIVSGDAYIDHPSFGAAIIGRVLEALGFKVGIIAQPDWKTPESLQVLGRPRYGMLISGGNMDSMVCHYTAAKKPRSNDAYTPGNKKGKRPDRATMVYANLAKRAFKKMPVIIGGVEASLRRLAHYDYWSDSLRRSMLLDSKADILVYGMGERAICEIATRLAAGESIAAMTDIPGTVVKTDAIPEKAIILPSHDELKKSKKAFAQSFGIQYKNTDPFNGSPLVENYGGQNILQNTAAPPLSREEMDQVYSLPFSRAQHPSYKEEIPAIREVLFSLVSSRGCFGACTFCALTFHQGRIVNSRSQESLIVEAKQLIRHKDFKGYIHDVGGPTANFRHSSCEKQNTKGSCKNKQCLAPRPCKQLNTDHLEYIELLRKLRNLDKVKKVFIRSGIRFDYLLEDKSGKFLEELCRHHVSGQLKVAPEHVSNKVLSYMGKPEHKVYQDFKTAYYKTNDKIGKEQYLVPYFISSHPGSTLEDAIELACYFKREGFVPEQVQDFYPTPGTLATAMYYTGFDPRTMKKVYTAVNFRDKRLQRALLQFNRPENFELVLEALKKAGRQDLIGTSPHCLVPAYKRPGAFGPRLGTSIDKPGKSSSNNHDNNRKSNRSKSFDRSKSSNRSKATGRSKTTSAAGKYQDSKRSSKNKSHGSRPSSHTPKTKRKKRR